MEHSNIDQDSLIMKITKRPTIPRIKIPKLDIPDQLTGKIAQDSESSEDIAPSRRKPVKPKFRFETKTNPKKTQILTNSQIESLLNSSESDSTNPQPSSSQTHEISILSPTQINRLLAESSGSEVSLKIISDSDTPQIRDEFHNSESESNPERTPDTGDTVTEEDTMAQEPIDLSTSKETVEQEPVDKKEFFLEKIRECIRKRSHYQNKDTPAAEITLIDSPIPTDSSEDLEVARIVINSEYVESTTPSPPVTTRAVTPTPLTQPEKGATTAERIRPKPVITSTMACQTDPETIPMVQAIRRGQACLMVKLPAITIPLEPNQPVISVPARDVAYMGPNPFSNSSANRQNILQALPRPTYPIVIQSTIAPNGTANTYRQILPKGPTTATATSTESQSPTSTFTPITPPRQVTLRDLLNAGPSHTNQAVPGIATPTSAPGPSRLVPAATTGPHLGDLDMILPDQGPCIRWRLQTVFDKMTTDNLNWKAEEFDKTVPDVWIEPVKEILRRLRLGVTLKRREITYMRRYLPHLVRRTLLDQQIEERADYCLGYFQTEEVDNFPFTYRFACISCDVCHKDHTVCQNKNGNGPRSAANLGAAKIWRHQATAFMIGTTSLFFQPITLRERLINLSFRPIKKYSTEWTAEELDPTDQGAESLYWTLRKKLDSIGSQNGLPVYVEYYQSPNSPNSDEACHICGFYRVLKSLQKTYLGPIIFLVGPSPPQPQESKEEYNRRKAALGKRTRLAQALSWAFCVPMAIFQAQLGPAGARNGHLQPALTHPHWRDEPLFSRNGVGTRELHHRTILWYTRICNFLLPQLPTDQELIMAQHIYEGE